MEGGDLKSGNGIGGSRWNPTKEQINLLENLYKQGVRTPSAEQIQQITNRLREFGHIEGKNVFYWFQNHKARQRQKQKQEYNININNNNNNNYIPYFNRFLHFPQYPNNVVCGPCYVQPTQSDFGYYQQYPKVPLPTAGGGYKRRVMIQENMEKNKEPTCTQTYNNVMQETLELFPVHPTGILSGKAGSSSENENDSKNNGSRDFPFFDFFCGN